MRRANLILLAPLAGFALVSSGCGFSFMSMALNQTTGSGKIASETRSVPAFSRIESSGSTDLKITIGSPTSLVVEADDNILPLITTTVSGDTLTIGSRGSYSTRHGVTITAVVPSLSALSLAGSGEADISGLDGPAFSVALSGSGDVEAHGTAEQVSVTVAGSGDVHLFDLAAKRANVSVTGSGDIEVNAANELSASVMGSGDISYKGTPAKLEKNVLGSGDISSVN